jgi:two-component sensor histidine kinase
MPVKSNRFKDLQIACAILGTNISALSRGWGVSDTWIKTVAEGRGKSGKISDRIDETIAEAANELPSSFLQSASKVVTDSIPEDGQSISYDVVREAHHRIKNQLSQLRSIVDLEAETFSDQNKEVVDVLRDISNRIDVIGQIHNQLSSIDQEASYLTLDELLHALVQRMEKLYRSEVNRHNISFELNCDRIEIPVQKGTHCAMLIHELIANSLKHGFNGQQDGKVTVELLKDGEQHINGEIRDNGVGWNLVQEDNAREKLGLTLVKHFFNHLDADYQIRSENGTRVSFRFQL